MRLLRVSRDKIRLIRLASNKSRNVYVFVFFRLGAIDRNAAGLRDLLAAREAAGALPLKLAPRPTSPAITPADLMTRLYIFADDSMLGRDTPSRGLELTARYVAGQFGQADLSTSAAERRDGQSAIAWTVGHVSQQVDSWLNMRLQGLPRNALLADPLLLEVSRALF